MPSYASAGRATKATFHKRFYGWAKIATKEWPQVRKYAPYVRPSQVTLAGGAEYEVVPTVGQIWPRGRR